MCNRRLICAIACAVIIAGCSGHGGSLIPSTKGRSAPAVRRAAASLNTPAFVQANSNSVYAPITITVSYATAPAVGDVLVVFFNNNGSTNGTANTYAAPSGWTQIDVDTSNYYNTYESFYNVVGSGENNSYVFTPSCACREHSVIYGEYANVNATAPIDAHGFTFFSNTATFTTPAQTPSQANDLAVVSMMPEASGQSWTNAAGWTSDRGPLSVWSTELLHELQTGVSSVSESSTLPVSSSGYGAVVLLKASGTTSTPTPPPTPTPNPGNAPQLVQRISYSPYAPSTITLSFSNAPTTGDVLLVFFNNNGTTSGTANTYTPPSGWNQIDLDSAHYYNGYESFYHVVGNGESNSYAFTPACACRAHSVMAAEYSNVNTSSPIDKHGFNFVSASASFVTPSESPSQANDLAVTSMMPEASNQSWTNAAGWTVDLGPLVVWSPEILHEAQSGIAPVSETSTLSTSSTGYAATVLLNPGATSTPTPQPVSYSDWNTFGDNLARWGYNPNETTIGKSNVANLHLIWKFNMGSAVDAQPLVATNVSINGTATTVLYVGAENGTFVALNADTGQQIWKQTLGSTSTSCSDLSGGQFGITGTATYDKTTQNVYVADGTNAIHALSMTTGAEAAGWPVNLAAQSGPPGTPSLNHIYGALTYNPANQLLYAETASICDTTPWYGRVVAINTTNPTSAPLSFFPAGQYAGAGIWGMGGASIDTATNDVYVATGNDSTTGPSPAPSETSNYGDAVIQLTAQLSVLNFSTAALFENDQDYGATPIIYTLSGCPEQVSAKNKSGILYTFNSSLGQLQALTMAGISEYGAFIGVPAFDPATNLVYVGDPISAGVVTQPGLVALSGCGGFNVAFDSAAGPPAVNDDNEAPTVANGVVYFTTGIGNQVYAFDASTGQALWNSGSTIMGATFAAPTVDGRLYLGSWDGNLYAFSL